MALVKDPNGREHEVEDCQVCGRPSSVTWDGSNSVDGVVQFRPGILGCRDEDDGRHVEYWSAWIPGHPTVTPAGAPPHLR